RRAFVTAIRTIAAAQQASPARAAASGASAADATQQLYERHQRRILAYCVSRLRDRQEAEDAVQNTFVYAFKLLERGVVPHAELPWLFTIAHNVCRSRKRALWRRGRVEASTDLDAYQEVFSAPGRGRRSRRTERRARVDAGDAASRTSPARMAGALVRRDRRDALAFAVRRR